MFQGFYQKFYEEVRSNTDLLCNVGIKHVKETNSVLEGMTSFTLGETFYNLAFNKTMYNERGGAFLASLL